MYSIGEDSFCRGLPICLGGWHTSKTIYINRGGDAGYCRGADSWRSTATCIQGADAERNIKHPTVFFPKRLWRRFTLTCPPSNYWKCQRGRSSGLVKTLNVRADFLSQYGLYCDTIAIRSESETYCII